MNTTTVKIHSLDYSQAKTYRVAALFVLGNIALPQLCHLIPQGGHILLPIYFFTLIAACKYGWKVGLLTAVASPLANSLLFGMPAVAALPAILFKSTVLAVAAGYAVSHYRKVSLPILAGVVLFYQIIGTVFEWAVSGSLFTALQDFRLGLAGMLLQIFGCWAVVRFLMRK